MSLINIRKRSCTSIGVFLCNTTGDTAGFRWFSVYHHSLLSPEESVASPPSGVSSYTVMEQLGSDVFITSLVKCLRKVDDNSISKKACLHSIGEVTAFFHLHIAGHCRRWRSRMEVKIMARSLFVHCKIAYFYSATAEKWLIVSLPNFVTIRRTHFSISWIRSTKLKIQAMEFCDFIKYSVSPSGLFVPYSLTVTSTWRPRLTAHCPIGERH